ncbi:metallophosphoesterase family protein [Allobaculum sp. JKK-2023]|uniref:metallophosphoesterase family protein n=1 Tax=Allobaculum sp. JKK-2023 TaxID=3108943 RepID=UPI002B058CD8|nr:metallophosphoesterase [Allobaculum sp. JKK-2023]
MKELVIIHLSDLHITEGQGYSRILGDLLADVKKQINRMMPPKSAAMNQSTLVIAVTGDIFHKGPKKDSKSPTSTKTAYEVAKEFFEQLHTNLKDYNPYIFFVPGNHDKCRSSYLTDLMEAQRVYAHTLTVNAKTKTRSKNFSLGFKNNFWLKILEDYKSKGGTGYLELVDEVSRKFNQGRITYDPANTYGVYEISSPYFFSQTGNLSSSKQLKFCFILMDTSWSCFNDNDKRNLLIGDFQVDELINKYHKIYTDEEHDPDLTFVLAHHPTNSLMGPDEDYLFNALFSSTGYGANFYLCGHIHNKLINNMATDQRSITTLMCGIGWPEDLMNSPTASSGMSGGPLIDIKHSYALYTFNLFENSVDILTRRTDTGGHFITDKMVPSGSKGSQRYDEMDHRSINIYDQDFLSFSNAKNNFVTGVYLNSELFGIMRNYIAILSNLQQQVDILVNEVAYSMLLTLIKKLETKSRHFSRQQVRAIRNGLFDLLTPINLGAETTEKDWIMVRTFIDENNDIVRDDFCEYLTGLARLYNQAFERVLDANNVDDPEIRIHFRIAEQRLGNDGKVDIVYPSVTYCPTEATNSKMHSPTDRKFQDLLKESFESESSLLYSANKATVVERPNSMWSDFITFGLNKGWNVVIDKNGEGSERPILTCGISVVKEEEAHLLQVLDLLKFSDVISFHIEQFTHLVGISLSDLFGF